jgi:hypothetical protein
MSVHVVPITRSTGDPADLAEAVGIHLYEGTHEFGDTQVAVVAYRVKAVWQPFPWKWSSHNGHVMVQVPDNVTLDPPEILLIA